MMVTAKRARLTGMIVVALTFAVGALSGAATMRVAAGDQADERPRQERPDLFERLDLTVEQQAQVDAIMARRRTEMDAFWAQHGPTLRAIYDATRTEIRAVLTPEQREIDDRFMAQRREHFMGQPNGGRKGRNDGRR